MARPKTSRFGRKPALPDVLDDKLKVVFCGWAAGKKSSRLGKYYANKGNRFWHTLIKMKLVPSKFCPCNVDELLERGIGLTDVCKFHAGTHPPPLDRELSRLIRKIKQRKPRVIAINGQKIAKIVLAFHWDIPKSRVNYGLQENRTIGKSEVWVLPSTSGRNRYWDENEHENYWLKLAAYIKN